MTELDTRSRDASPEVGAHRQRLVDGMAAALRERAYRDVTIGDIVRHARTSRRTFYEHFPSKQDCLIALLRDSHARLVGGIAAAVDPQAAWPVQIRQAIQAWIAGVQADPDVTLSWIRVVPSLGDDARDLSRATMDSFAQLIGSLSDTPELRRAGITPPSRQETTILLGGLRELIATTVEDGGDVGEIVDVATEVTTRILVPQPR
ncbi:MAG: TetR/AcrR family transcriptional regulator [Marmoricola sp.]